MAIQNLQKLCPLNNLDYTEHQIQYNSEYLKKTIISFHLFQRQWEHFLIFRTSILVKKLKESVSSTSCGTGIIIALPQNSSLSQRSIKHSSSDKGQSKAISETSEIIPKVKAITSFC